MYSTGKDLIFCNDIYKLRQPRKFWATYTWNISVIRKTKNVKSFLISRGRIICKTICRNFYKLQNKIAYFSTHPMLEKFELVPRFLPTYFTVAIIITYILAKNLNFYTAIKNCINTWRLPNSYTSSDFLEFEFRKWPHHEEISK